MNSIRFKHGWWMFKYAALLVWAFVTRRNLTIHPALYREPEYEQA